MHPGFAKESPDASTLISCVRDISEHSLYFRGIAGHAHCTAN